ncbi:MAG: hypothetical protein QNK05_16160 [Myxococcota bacterium]|nr:hypothetical protein [Myxococcota bacterium]
MATASSTSARISGFYEASIDRAAGIPRLQFRVPRLHATFRITYAFHAREVRFEADTGSGFGPAFPETFSFHAERHDPTELYLRFEDVWTNPARLAPGAARRDAEEMVLRLLEALPGYLEEVLDQLVERGQEAPLVRASEDVAVFSLVVARFVDDKGLGDRSRLVTSGQHLRRLTLRALQTLMDARVRPEFVERLVAGEVVPVRGRDPHDLGFFYALAEGDPEEIDSSVTAATELAYYRWLEDVCLDEENRAFEREGSPFGDREAEIMKVVALDGSGPVVRSRDLSPFLRQPGHRDCVRLLGKLENWFLRIYDVPNASALMTHGARMTTGNPPDDRRLARISTRTLGIALGLGALPFVASIFFYSLAPTFFDVWVSAEIGLIVGAAAWFLFYRFMWKKDLVSFHASIPRIGAGIIVGYLPVFLIDEVWDLAEQSLFYILFVVVLLGSTTLLYIYVEVQRKLGDPELAFSRAFGIFLLGIAEAAAFGALVTSLLGPLMAVRNWVPEGVEASLPAVRESLPAFVGELPKVVGLEFLPAFPSAVLLMTFLSFFIGTFLQLLWEDLPITEPL